MSVSESTFCDKCRLLKGRAACQCKFTFGTIDPSMLDAVPDIPAPRGAPTTVEVNAVLAERGSRYGVFEKHAEVTQNIKYAIFDRRSREDLAPDQAEALEMIAHKIGRIVNGDPDYADSWIDIAGYAQLVADRLQGVKR